MYFNCKLTQNKIAKTLRVIYEYHERGSQFEKKMVKNIIFRKQLWRNYQDDDSRKDWKTPMFVIDEWKEGGLMRGRVENRRWSKRDCRVISFERLNSTFHVLSRLFIARQQVNAYISGVRV